MNSRKNNIKFCQHSRLVNKFSLIQEPIFVITSKIFTIGHSNKSLSELIAILEQFQIDTLVDVRSVPFSKYVPQFNKKNLENFFKEHKITYEYWGKELGGMSPANTLTRSEYYQVAQNNDRFRNNISELAKKVVNNRVAIMCAEEDPKKCHRKNLLTPALKKHDLQVMHIRHDLSMDIEEMDIGYFI